MTWFLLPWLELDKLFYQELLKKSFSYCNSKTEYFFEALYSIVIIMWLKKMIHLEFPRQKKLEHLPLGGRNNLKILCRFFWRKAIQQKKVYSFIFALWNVCLNTSVQSLWFHFSTLFLNLKYIIRDYQFKVITLHRAIETTENHEWHHISLSPVCFSDTKNCFMEKMSPYWAAKSLFKGRTIFPQGSQGKTKWSWSIYLFKNV